MIGFRKSLVLAGLAFLFLLFSGTAQEARALGQLTLTWNDTADNETGFEIERTKTADSTVAVFTGPANPLGGQTVYQDTSVVEGTEYCYRVRAFNAAGESAYTNAACGISLSIFSDGFESGDTSMWSTTLP